MPALAKHTHRVNMCHQTGEIQISPQGQLYQNAVVTTTAVESSASIQVLKDSSSELLSPERFRGYAAV
jgi:hypothetical protein